MLWESFYVNTLSISDEKEQREVFPEEKDRRGPTENRSIKNYSMANEMHEMKACSDCYERQKV